MSNFILPAHTHKSQSTSASIHALIGTSNVLAGIFYVIHTAHSLWRWQKRAERVNMYFQDPRLAVADSTIAVVAKDDPWLQIAANILEAGTVALKAQWHLQRFRLAWKRLEKRIQQINDPMYLLEDLIGKPKALNFHMHRKVCLIANLAKDVLYQAIHLSVCMLDMYVIVEREPAQNEAAWRIASNAQILLELATRLELSTSIHDISNDTPDINIFNYFGIDPIKVEESRKLLEQVYGKPSNKAFEPSLQKVARYTTAHLARLPTVGPMFTPPVLTVGCIYKLEY